MASEERSRNVDSAFLRRGCGGGHRACAAIVPVSGRLAPAPSQRRGRQPSQRRGIVYIEHSARVAEALELQVTAAGGNVLLAVPFDAVVFDRTWSDPGVPMPDSPRSRRTYCRRRGSAGRSVVVN
jgi:hypothetical protein